MSSRTRTLTILATGVLIIALLCCGSLWWFVYNNITRDITLGQDLYNIEEGSSLRDFSKSLTSDEIIAQEWPLLVWATVTGRATRIQAGEYRFPENTNLKSIVQQILDGKVVTYPLTIIEGWTFNDIRKMLQESEHLTDDIADLSELEILKAIGSSQSHAEGLFFPDTYYSSRGDSRLAILKVAHDTMTKHLDAAWQQKSSEAAIVTPYEALILASIIEKESVVDVERTIISGVLSNRLRQNILLQTDPTIIYGIGDAYDGALRKSDLTNDGPYNTYTRRGLPPTPISSPGMKSLIASVQPKSTSKMFFVARGDGTHEFSDTLDQHNAAVNKYQRNN